jgi:hypothetical protein
VAQFLTYRGRVVVQQYGAPDKTKVFVKFANTQKFVPIEGQVWQKEKVFVVYDGTKMTRQAAYAAFAAGRLDLFTKQPPKKEHWDEHAPGKRSQRSDQPAGRGA